VLICSGYNKMQQTGGLNKQKLGCLGLVLDAWGWCTGMTQRDGVGREEGGGRRVQDGEHMYTN